jgi:hypothetical protein
MIFGDVEVSESLSPAARLRVAKVLQKAAVRMSFEKCCM